MSLDLRIHRHRRPIIRWRRPLLWLAATALILAGMVAWQRGWRPDAALAYFDQAAIPVVSASIAQIADNPAQAKSEEPAVVMVDSQIVDSPQSDAYTADLHAFAGEDDIPWPHVGNRGNLIYYTVQDGDSLWGIAQQFELDIDTLRWSNPALERNPDVLSVGAELHILPVPGVYHVAEQGETIESIAAVYGVAPEDIATYPPNALFSPYELEPGQGLIVPYGRKEGLVLPQPSPAPEAAFAWPLVGIITQGYNPGHPALDIGAPYGSTVYAADDGTITYATWAQTGYGYTIIVDHGNGRESWYNHLKGTLLPAGNYVTRGTPIGQVGSTGHSTGPHLHFEIRINGEYVNPVDYLPGATPQ